MHDEDDQLTSEAENSRLNEWLLAGLHGEIPVASYLTSKFAVQYRLLVDVLLDAQDTSLTGVGFDDLFEGVRDRLARSTDPAVAERITRPEAFPFRSRLDSLEKWNVVVRWQDAARTEADFTRVRDRFQLTPEAADLHRWVRRSEAADLRATSAATFAPAVITERLEDFRSAVGADDHTAAAQAWAQVDTTLKDMADSAALWQSRLASSLAGAPTDEKMAALRDTLMSYIQVWGAGIDTHSPRIRTHMATLDGFDERVWRAVALAALPSDVDDERLATTVAAHLRTTAILRAWFAERTGQAESLRRQVRDAVIPFLRGSRALLSTGGVISRRTELLRVAQEIESAPDDSEGWRVWAACLGLWSARHLPGVPPDAEGTHGRQSFWAAPEVRVDQKLRERGPRTNRGRAKNIPNRRRVRERIKAATEHERERRSRADEAFLARSGRTLNVWATAEDPMTDLEFALFRELLTAVMRARPGPGGTLVAYSTDSRFEVSTAAPAPGEPRTAVVHSSGGAMACANHVWRVRRT